MLCSILLLAACSAPKFDKKQEVVQQTEKTKEKAIIPNYKISDSYYRTILPFKAGEARGLVVENLNTRFDINEFETGLMRMSHDSFPPDKYYFQEGQYLDGKTISSWLQRKLSPKQLEEERKNNKDYKNDGLNPINSEKGTLEEQNKQNPIYLAHILEHDYLVKNGDKVQLGGISIGLAMNSVHEYIQEQGYPREVKIDQKEIEQHGKEIAQEVISRIRKMNGLQHVPVVIALFKQEASNSITPGNFITKAVVPENDTQIGDWKKVDEEYFVFPSTKATSSYREDAMNFDEFKANIEDYFPNYTGVIGRGFYQDGHLQSLSIQLPMQFYGKAEVIGFTQYVTGLIMEQFPTYMAVQVYISSVSGPESIIVRDAGEKKPFVHIYQ